MLLRIALVAALILLVGCRRPLDQRLIGRWKEVGSPVEVTFRPDHTFDLKQAQTFSGTWEIAQDQLITRTEPLPSEEQTDSYEIHFHRDDLTSDAMFL